MIHIKLFEDFSNITEEQILDCIEKNGSIYVDFIENYKGDTSDPMTPVSIEGDTVTVEKDGNYYDVKLKNIKKLNYGKL